MENASKSLIMVAGVLIGVLILSLWVYLFAHFGSQTSQVYDRIEEHQLTEYNAQYTVYEGRTDINIYDIITLANKAHQNNEDYGDYTDFENLYKVTVNIIGIRLNLQDYVLIKQHELIKTYGLNYRSDENLVKIFKCNEIKYHSNGRIKSISFIEN